MKKLFTTIQMTLLMISVLMLGHYIINLIECYFNLSLSGFLPFALVLIMLLIASTIVSKWKN
jgi:hypothetical protein